MTPCPERIPGRGWIALLGGGEFSFGDTEEADRAWLARTADGPVGFVPTASGSTEYGGYFAAYLRETFSREVEPIPIYRRRDARRGKNLERLAACPAVYLGGGLADHLLDALTGEPAALALAEKVRQGGMLAAMAASAQALGRVARSPLERRPIDGLELLPGGAVEPNFDPGHDRRLREMMAHPEVRWGLGIPAEAAVLLGPGGELEIVGEAYVLDDVEGDLLPLEPSNPHFSPSGGNPVPDFR